MFENMGDMSKMFEGIQENASKIQAQLESKIFCVKSGGGMVEISMNGKGEIIDLKIDNSLLCDKAFLEILLIGAVNDANKMLMQNQQNSVLDMFGGMNPFGSK